MKYIFIVTMLCLTATAFSQEKATDISWIKSWGESASTTAKLIKQNSEKQLELNNEILQLKKTYETQTDAKKPITLKLIESKLRLIELLMKDNITNAQVIDQIIQIQKKGLPE